MKTTKTEEKASQWLLVYDSNLCPGCYELNLGSPKGPLFSKETALAIGRKFMKEQGQRHGLTALRWFRSVYPQGVATWVFHPYVGDV